MQDALDLILRYVEWKKKIEWKNGVRNVNRHQYIQLINERNNVKVILQSVAGGYALKI